jgi:hypothetical protein
MVWSKTRKSIEGLMANALQKRVKFHVIRYGPGLSYIQDRTWITFDGKEILTCSTIGWIRENCRRSGHLGWDIGERAERELAEAGYFPRQEFVSALSEYLDMQVDEALQSLNIIIRSIAMFDRRLGKRRLQAMRLSEDEHPLVKKFYAIRSEVDGID